MVDRFGKHLLRRLMSGKTRPISIRLTNGEIEQLQARAYTLSAKVTGVARDLILTGLVGGDNKALADRLMRIERRLVALEQQSGETHAQIQSIDKAGRDLLAMFEALLKALTGESSGRAA
jgi:phosphate uptake regulator